MSKDHVNVPPTEPTGVRSARQRGDRGCAIAVVALLIIVVIALIVSMPKVFTLLRNGANSTLPLSEGAAYRLLLEHQTEALAQLNSYGWVDQSAGVAHVPIERAMTLLAASELPVGAVAATQDETTAAVGAVDLSDVNFTDDILPIFQARCAECHGDDNPDEGLVLTTYKDVMLGSIYGAVVKPGDPEGSYLVEMVVSGQMPKKGPDLTPTEIETIVAWIDAGAPEHGSALSNSPPISETNATSNTVSAVARTPETVSFAADVLPIFQDRCAECHGDNDPEEDLILTSYRDVMLGSVYGAVIKPNNPDDSYLIETVTSGQMPKKGPDLTQAQIDTIIAWVNAGAPDN